MSITIENITPPSVDQWKITIQAMRLPMWSGDKTDSGVCYDLKWDREYIDIGPKDMALMQKLAKAGSDHRKFLRMLPVHMEVIAPMVFLTQFDTYKVGTVSCGSSKMHRLFHKPFDFSDFGYGGVASKDIPATIWQAVGDLNWLRDVYLYSENKEEKAKAWKEAIDILPESYHQTRIFCMNYEVLWNMYNARKNHKIGEWREFCDTIICKIPYFADIFQIGGVDE